MTDPDRLPDTALEKELWLQGKGVPLPPYPNPPDAEKQTDESLRAADQAYLQAWEDRENEVDRMFEVAQRDAAAPQVPAVRGSETLPDSRIGKKD